MEHQCKATQTNPNQVCTCNRTSSTSDSHFLLKIMASQKKYRCKFCNGTIPLQNAKQPLFSVDVGDVRDRVQQFHKNCWPVVRDRWATKYGVKARCIRYYAWPKTWRGLQICDSENSSNFESGAESDSGAEAGAEASSSHGSTPWLWQRVLISKHV